MMVTEHDSFVVETSANLLISSKLIFLEYSHAVGSVARFANSSELVEKYFSSTLISEAFFHLQHETYE